MLSESSTSELIHPPNSSSVRPWTLILVGKRDCEFVPLRGDDPSQPETQPISSRDVCTMVVNVLCADAMLHEVQRHAPTEFRPSGPSATDSRGELLPSEPPPHDSRAVGSSVRILTAIFLPPIPFRGLCRKVRICGSSNLKYVGRAVGTTPAGPNES